MPGPIKLEIDHVEMLDDNGVEWSMTFEEILGGIGPVTLRVQDRNNTWMPARGMDIKATIRDGAWAGHVLYRGEVMRYGFSLEPGEEWITWAVQGSDYNNELPNRKVGAFDGKIWLDTSGLGVFVNVDPFANTLETDKLTIQRLFDHYVRVDGGTAIDTSTYVNEYLTDIFSQEWSYTDVQKALEELAAQIQDNLQFWIDPDLKFHWVTIPAWQDILQDGAALVGAEDEETSALLFPEGAVGELIFAPYNVVDVNPDGVDTIGFSKLQMDFDGSEMPEQIYVRGGTGYTYTQLDEPSTTKSVVQAPTPGVEAEYKLTFLATTRIWHKNANKYIDDTYGTASAGGPYKCKWVKVPWNEALGTGGNYWKLLEGPYAGKFVDDSTNTLTGYGSIKVKEIIHSSTTPVVGVGGSGWVQEVTQDPEKRQSYLDAPISTDVAKRNSIGGQALYRGQYPTLRGSVEVYGLDGWRVGQVIKITDARLPASMNNRYFVIQSVKSSLLEGNDLRRYQLSFGDGPKSRWTMRQRPGDITWPPPFAYIEIDVFDVSPGPNSSQRITAQLVAPDGTPWRIHGKTVNWSLECYNAAGVLQPDADGGTLEPEVTVTNQHGRTHTKFTSGPNTGRVYYIFANVKAT